MLRPISTLPLPNSASMKLQEAGFLFLEDILENEASKVEVCRILRQWGKDIWDTFEKCIAPPKLETALDIWQTELNLRSIVTFCEQVDNTLGGGIPLRRISEFCGAPGTGKTQFCLQLCVSVQVPRCLGGVSGEALYIDTDSGFSPIRLQDIAKSCARHCGPLLKGGSLKEGSAQIEEYTEESILNGVHYIAVNEYEELLGTVSLLDNFLETNGKEEIVKECYSGLPAGHTLHLCPRFDVHVVDHHQGRIVMRLRVKLIIIDSLAYIFRYGSTSFKDRTRLLYRIMADLRSLTLKFNIAVVVTNQLTTSLELTPEDGSISKSSLIPSLGDSFAHLVDLRLMLGPAPPSVPCSSNGKAPLMMLVTKNCDPPCGSALFEIEEGGIRDAS